MSAHQLRAHSEAGSKMSEASEIQIQSVDERVKRWKDLLSKLGLDSASFELLLKSKSNSNEPLPPEAVNVCLEFRSSSTNWREEYASELADLVFQGIPDCLRPLLWCMFLDVPTMAEKSTENLGSHQTEQSCMDISPIFSKLQVNSKTESSTPGENVKPDDNPRSYYQHLLAKLDAISTPEEQEIQKDLHRTLPTHPMFQSDEGRNRLKEVLSAFSWHDTIVGRSPSAL